MPLNTDKISQAAMEFMAALEGDEDYSDSEIAEVGIVVHLRTPEDDGGNKDNTPTYCTNDSRIYQTGLFRWAEGSVEWSSEPGSDIPGPDDA